MIKKSLQEQWDWSLLYYLGTVVLNMTEEEFWKCTPRKLFALLEVHDEVNGSAEEHGQNGKITNPQQVLKQFMSW
jgi:hypothetical protein